MTRVDPLENLPVLFAAFLEQLRAELASSTKGVRDTGARAIALGTGAATGVASTSAVASTAVSGSVGSIAGFALRETTGTGTAVVRFLDGRDGDGDFLFDVTLAAGESTREWWGEGGGVQFIAGLRVVVVSGTVNGSVFLRGPE